MGLHSAAQRWSPRLAWLAHVALFVTWVAAWSSRAAAEPSLHVRASSRLELHTRRDANVVRIEGVLSDDLDVPLAGRSVRLSVEQVGAEPPLSAAARETRADAQTLTDASWTRVVRTNPEGRFSQALTLSLGRYRLGANYAGDALHAASALERTVDVALHDVELQIVLPRGRAISLDDPQLEIELRARSEAGGAGLTIMVLDQDRRSLAHGVSDEQGTLRLTVPTDALGEPGPGQLIAISAADGERAAGRTESSVLRLRATALTLMAAWDESQESLRMSGTLHAGKAPVAGKAIGLFIAVQHVQTVSTDSAGRFAYALEAATDPTAQLGRAARSGETIQHVSARFDSDTPGLESSRAPEQAVIVPAWGGPNLIWLILPSLASLLLVGWILRRNRGWLAPARRSETFEAGVQLGAAKQHRAAGERGVSGVIEDADTAARLGTATLSLIPLLGSEQAAAIGAPVAADGRFAVAALPPGHYRFEARAPGYALESSELRIPHAGEGAGLRVRLRSLRTLALEAHRPLVRRVFATRESQIAATPREALRQAAPLWPRSLVPPAATPDRAKPSGDAPSRELERVTELVEQTAFSAREPTVEQVQAIEDAMTELLKRSV